MESSPYAWLRCRARAAARLAFHEHFDPVGGLLAHPFTAAVEAIVEVCRRDATPAAADEDLQAADEDEDECDEDDDEHEVLPRGVVESVVIPVVDCAEVRDRLADREVWPADELLEELTTGWTEPPPIQVFVDDATGPIREENPFVSLSGASRAVHSFVHGGTVYLVWFGDASVDEHSYHAAYRITDPPEVARRWYERVARWVEADDPDGEEEWPEDWWPEGS